MKCKLLLFLFAINLYAVANAQVYKEMMTDYSVNFYDVVEEGERYFNTLVDKNAKGTGYKGFKRWINNNEYKYYPTGRRDNIDPNFAYNSLRSYRKQYPEQFSVSGRMMSSGWRELGPNSVDLVTGHYSAGIGRIEEVYADPGNQDKLYLGSRSGGLWRSLDEGQTWMGGSTDFVPGSGVNTFAVDPANTDHLLVNVRNSRNGTTYGVYESVDGGATLVETTFNPANLGEGGLGSNFQINVIAYHPTIPNMVFVGTNRGLYKSTDNLSTWVEVDTTDNYPFIEFHPTDPSIIYAINQSGFANRNYLYKSSDTGDSFNRTTEIADNNGSRGRIEVSANAPMNVYFANNNGIHKSTDEGETFTLVAVPSATGGVGAFGINDTDETNMITGGIDAYRSDDEGLSFTKVTYWSLGSSQHGPGDFQTRYQNSTVYVHADLRKINSVNGTFYMGTDGTIAKSEDGGTTWVDLMRDGVGVRENYKLGVSQSNNGIAIAGSQDNGTSIYKDTGWVEFYGADGMEGLIHPLNDDWMIGSVQFGSRRRTKDGGFSQGGVTPSGTSQGYWQAPLAYDPNNHMTIYDFRDGVRKSEDFGSTYTLVGTPSFSGTMHLAEIAQNDSNIIVVSSGNNIEKSVDGGATFLNIKGTLPNHSIQDIAFDPLNDSNLLVVNASYQNNGEKVFLSTDGGSSWNNITFNMGNIPVHTVVVDHSPDKNIYLGTEVGVYTKPWNASSWTLYNTDLPNTTIEELEINYGANTIKAATWGRGLWEYDLVDRANFPSINYTEITDVPTDDKPKEGVEQYVTSIIEYAGALTDVYVRWSIGTPDFTIADNTIQMNNVEGNTWVSDSALPNELEGAKVYFKVFAEGDSYDISETYKFMYTVKPFAVCEPNVQNGTSDFINLVEVNDDTTTIYSNSSGNDGYTSYDNDPIEMNLGDSYTINVQLQGAFSEDDAAVWLDFNRNAEFDDSELIIMSPYVSNVSSGTINVPLDAVTNQTITMRVRNSFFNDPEACNFDAGEVEDYIVQLVDAQLPIANCQDITVQLDENGMAIITPEQIDNGSLAPAGGGIFSIDINTFDCTMVGVNQVQFTITDGNGISDTCQATVVVQDVMLPEVITQDITVQLDDTGTASITPLQVDDGSFDNCGLAALSLDVLEFDCNDVGDNIVTLSVTDNSGLTSTEVAVVTVVDATPPEVNTQDITVELDIDGMVSITPVQINNGSTDNCGIASLVLDIQNFDCDDVGANTVTLTVTDSSGGITTETAVVTVEDNIDLVIDAPSDITINTTNTDTACETIVNYDPVLANDNCEQGTIIVTQTSGLGSGASFPVGTTTEVYEIEQPDGTITTYSFDVFVEDGTDPEISDCPENTTEFVVEGESFIIPDYGTIISLSDNCTDVPEFEQSPAPGVLVQSNTTTTIVLTATDEAGNETVCSFLVSVENQTLGLDDTIFNDINVYPNPVQSQLIIEHLNHHIETLTIYNILGQTVLEGQPGENRTTIDMSQLESALYILFIETEEGVMTRRLIKE